MRDVVAVVAEVDSAKGDAVGEEPRSVLGVARQGEADELFEVGEGYVVEHVVRLARVATSELKAERTEGGGGGCEDGFDHAWDVGNDELEGEVGEEGEEGRSVETFVVDWPQLIVGAEVTVFECQTRDIYSSA